MSAHERASKRQKFLDEDSSDETAGILTINSDYAQRFEHNKKREELSRLEEKAKLQAAADEDDSSSDDEDEDDIAELATAELDDEIQATLRAIKSKDPRRLDPNVTFYRDFENEAGEKREKGEKPMYLQDYHRGEYMKAVNGQQEQEEEEVVPTYQQEQDQLKRELVGSMHAAAAADEEGGEEEDFMVAKSRSRHEDLPPLKKKSKPVKKITDADVKAADADPETFLSNFMAARAWLPTNADGSRFAPLEDDDSDDDARADEFEEAYNLRFEDPAKANEKLASFARDVGKYGVRREEKTGRAKARDREKERKEALKRELEEDKARLRKLKIEDAEAKVKKIKEAAGLRGKDVDLEAWRGVIEGDFDDGKWEEEMRRRFGEDYYAAGSEEEDEDDEAVEKKKKAKKPKWDDDIEIGDLIPDFDAGEKPAVALSDDDEEEGASETEGGVPLPTTSSDNEDQEKKKKKSKKDRAREKSDAKRASRKERMQIESIVDASLPLTTTKPSSGFRYRETSPTSFGLSARDILFADDTALNNFAGLKKMAAFRDEEKKRRDKKKFGKKARLKAWRRETFGDGEEPTGGFEKVLGKEGEGVQEGGKRWPSKKRKVEDDGGEGGEGGGEGGEGGKRKKKRSKKSKA